MSRGRVRYVAAMADPTDPPDPAPSFPPAGTPAATLLERIDAAQKGDID